MRNKKKTLVPKRLNNIFTTKYYLVWMVKVLASAGELMLVLTMLRSKLLLDRLTGVHRY